jgi:hypothetical protein
MTVENTNNTISYTGNGSVDTFAYNFLVYSESHIFIYFDDVLQTVGYTVEDVGDEGGGNIVFDAPPDTGVTIRIDRTVPDTQLIEYQEYGPFPAKANERGLDLLTMSVQQNAREIGRDFERIDAAKMDKQPIADTDNIIIFDSEGNSKDSGKKITDIERSGGSYVGELPPTFPNQGDRWTRCTDMKGFIWYVDEDGGQWVEDRPSYVLPSENGEVISVNGKDGDVVLTTDDISDSASLKKYTTEAEKTKLSGIEDNATANSSDATLLDRANHTGTQAASTISDFESTVSSNADVTANNAKVSFPEAPNDGKQYTRKDLGWEEFSRTSVQETIYLTDPDTLTHTLEADDTGKMIVFNTANSSVVEVPDGLPLGTSVVICNLGLNDPAQGGVSISINEQIRGTTVMSSLSGIMSITKVVAGIDAATSFWQSSER